MDELNTLLLSNCIKIDITFIKVRVVSDFLEIFKDKWVDLEFHPLLYIYMQEDMRRVLKSITLFLFLRISTVTYRMDHYVLTIYHTYLGSLKSLPYITQQNP